MAADPRSVMMSLATVFAAMLDEFAPGPPTEIEQTNRPDSAAARFQREKSPEPTVGKSAERQRAACEYDGLRKRLI